MSGRHGWHRRHDVLAVHDLDPVAPDQVAQKGAKVGIEFLVLEIVPDVRHRRCGCAVIDDAEVVVRTLANDSRTPRTRLHDRDVMTARSQSAGELVRTPAAAAANRWERVGG